MTHDPTTPEGREELRRLLANSRSCVAMPRDDDFLTIRESSDVLIACFDALDAKDAEIERLKKEFTAEMTETVHELSSETTRLNAKLAALRDGIAEVVHTSDPICGYFRIAPKEVSGFGTKSSPYVHRVSFAGAKLAQLWRESE